MMIRTVDIQDGLKGLLNLYQRRQLSGKPYPGTLDNHHTIDALYCGDILQSRIDIINISDKVCGLCGGCVRQCGIFCYNRGKIALAQAHRVSHFSRGRAY